MRFYAYIISFVLFLCQTGLSQSDSATINQLNALADELSDKNTDSAMSVAQKALDLSIEKNYKAGKANAINNLAVCNDIKGNSDIAIKQFIEAIKLFEELKDDNKTAQCYSQMGICYFLQYQYDNAQLYYSKAIDLYKKTHNDKDLAGVLINQGIVFTYIGKLNDAEKNYLQALEIYKASNNLSGLSPAYNSLAKIYYTKKDYKTAIETYRKSEQYSIATNNSYNLISTYNSLALCYKELKQYNEAKKCSEKSIELSKKIGAVEREVFCHETLASILFDMGDYKNAYISFQHYASLKDTLFTQDKNESIAEMQAKFDVEKNQQKVKEIELQKQLDDDIHAKQRLVFTITLIIILLSLLFVFILFRNKKRINVLLEQKNAAIQANLEQKEIMMGEIHHRVKNNLQMVSSILDLQARDLTDERSMRIIEDSLSRINAISLIHQRLYQSENIRGIKINTYLQELSFDILKNFSSSVKTNPIRLTCHIDDLDMDLESAIPIGLITAELITNACKYAFKDISQPKIEIRLTGKDNSLELSVSDNGVGKQTTINESATTFGTKLIRSLSRKLRAEMTEDTSAKGTRIQLKITNFKLYAG
jgi:two-component sensor histidine kinase